MTTLRADVDAAIRGEDERPLAGLRQRPFWQRQLVGVGALALLLVATVTTMPRRDLSLYPPWRLILELASFGLVFGLCLSVALRGAHRPPLPRVLTLVLAATSVITVALLGLLPPPHAHDPYVSRGLDELLSPCALVGVAIGLPVYAFVRMLDRGSALSGIAAASAAGLAANSLLQVRCSVTDSTHFVFGHAMIGVWLVLGVGLVGAMEGWRRRR